MNKRFFETNILTNDNTSTGVYHGASQEFILNICVI